MLQECYRYAVFPPNSNIARSKWRLDDKFVPFVAELDVGFCCGRCCHLFFFKCCLSTDNTEADSRATATADNELDFLPAHL